MDENKHEINKKRAKRINRNGKGKIKRETNEFQP